jgi:3-hydroxybutyryl-CoA dehydrogenase
MGLGIAYVSALHAKVPTLLTDKSQTQLKSGLTFFKKLLEKDVNKGRISSANAKEALDRVGVVNEVKDMRDVDMVVEVSTR